tara:strand:- start:78 stop:353 length:276 start_codon:yes stop_codon:yes gene_type:complete
MKTTRRELKQIIAEEIKNALKEQGGQHDYDEMARHQAKQAGLDVPEEAPFDTTSAVAVSPAAKEADPLEMLKRVKAMVDKAIADVEASKKS